MDPLENDKELLLRLASEVNPQNFQAVKDVCECSLCREKQCAVRSVKIEIAKEET